MYQKDSKNERKRKIDFLNGLLSGQNSIYEIVRIPTRCFMLSKEEGICFLADFNNQSKPILTNGKYKRFTLGKLMKMKERDPVSCIIISFEESARPPFPTLDEEAK